MKIEFDGNELINDVMDGFFISMLKNQLKNSREYLAQSYTDEDKDTNQGVINACLCLLAFCTTQNDFADLIDDEELIPIEADHEWL